MNNENKWIDVEKYIEENFNESREATYRRIPNSLMVGSSSVSKKHGIKRSPMPSLASRPNFEMIIEETFQQMLFRLIDERGLKDSDVYNKASVDKRLFSKIRQDRNYHPSKATVILLCFGLELEIDTALDLLTKAGYTLSFSRVDDLIIRYFLEKKEYDVVTVNNCLYDHDQSLLFR